MTPELVLITTREIAERYRVSSGAVRSWVDKGLLKPAVTLPGGQYRFDPADVDRLLGREPAA